MGIDADVDCGNTVRQEIGKLVNRSAIQGVSVPSSSWIAGAALNRDQRQHDDLMEGTSNIYLLTTAQTLGTPVSTIKHPGPANTMHLVSHPSMQRHSRLPPNTVARKAPRKSTMVSNPTVQGSMKVSKPTSKATNTPGLYARPSHPRVGSKKTQQTLEETTSHAKPPQLTAYLPVGSRKVIPNQSVQQDIVGPITSNYESTLKTNDESGALSTSIPVEAIAEIVIELHPDTTVLPTDSQSSVQCQGPQLRFGYNITPSLDGVRRALGQSNWTAYLVLTEKLVREEINDREFEGQERLLFQVFEENLRIKIRQMVRRDMVVSTSEPEQE